MTLYNFTYFPHNKFRITHKYDNYYTIILCDHPFNNIHSKLVTVEIRNGYNTH